MPFVEREPPRSAVNAPSRKNATDVPDGIGYLIFGPLLVPLVLNFFGDQIFGLISLLSIWIKAHVSSVLFEVLFVAIVIVISALLYLLRSKHRKSYGVLEITFGISASVFAANGFYASTEQDAQFRNLVAVFGGIYIIIRGLDNWAYRPPTK